MEPITIWKKYDEKKNQFEHNHIESGHNISDEPTPISDKQRRSWAGAKWKKVFAFLNNGKVEAVNQ